MPDEKKNRFFPEGGGVVSHGIGALDLILGSGARAIEGSLIAVNRGQDPFEAAGRSALGFPLDGGEWGAGEVASGLELLEEMGAVDDKESLTNNLAGAAVDVGLDLLLFNAAGAARKGTALASDAPKSLFSHRGVKFASKFRPGKHRRGKDFVEQTQHEARKIKTAILHAMTKTQRKALRKDLGEHGKLVFSGKGRLKEVTTGPVRTGIFKRDGHKVKKRAHEFIDFDDVEIKYTGPSHRLQELYTNPTLEQLGRAAGDVVDEAPRDLGGFMMKHLDDFEVVDVSLAKNYAGTNRPASTFEAFFSKKDFFRKIYPTGEISKIPVNVSLKGVKIKPGLFEYLPPWMNPFDFLHVHRKTGIMGPMIRGSNRYHDALERDLTELGKLAEGIGLKQGNLDYADRVKNMAKFADGQRDYLTKLSEVDRKFVDKVREIETRLAKTQVFDPRLKGGRGGYRQALPDEYFRAKDYFHRIRTDRQQIASQDFIHILDSGKDGSKAMSIDVRGGMMPGVKVGAWMKRIEDSEYVEWDIVKSAVNYIVAANRKIHLEPELLRVRPELIKLNQRGTVGLFDNATHAVQNFFGNYSKMDGYLGSLLDRIPGLPEKFKSVMNPATRASVELNSWTYRAMLGLNPRTTILQVMQGIVNNTMALGMADSFKGFFKAIKGVGNKQTMIPRQSKIFNGFLDSLEKEVVREFRYGPQSGTKKFFEWFDNSVLFAPLQGFDNFNRAWAYHGAVSLAERHGLSKAQAMLQGIKASNETQFIYGRLGASGARNNPLGRLMMQFQSYTTKQLSFMAQQARRDPGINFLRFMAITGVITRSVGKHIDINSELVPTTPGDAKDLLAFKRTPALMSLEALYDFGKAVTEEAAGVSLGGQSVDSGFAAENLAKTFVDATLPAGVLARRAAKYGPTLFEGIPAEAKFGPYVTGPRGEEVDKWGRKIRDLTNEEAGLALVGFRSTKAARERAEIEKIRFSSDLVNRRRSYYMTQAVRAAINGRDPSPWVAETQHLTGQPRRQIVRSLRQRIRNRRKTLLERTRERSPKIVR